MTIIDSKKQQLSFPEIITQALGEYGFTGMDYAKAATLLVEELQMENCEAQSLGNTVFVAHYNPDKTSALLKVLTADTQTNLLESVGKYLKRLRKQGTDLVVYMHEDKTPMPIFSYIEQHKLGTTQTKQNSKGQFATLINTTPPKDGGDE